MNEQIIIEEIENQVNELFKLILNKYLERWQQVEIEHHIHNILDSLHILKGIIPIGDVNTENNEETNGEEN